MCPQLSLQVMMGVGTPTAWQVNVTVAPRAAWTDSSGGLVTEGGAAKCQEDENCFTHIINAHVQKKKKAGMWLEFDDPVKLVNAWQSKET